MNRINDPNNQQTVPVLDADGRRAHALIELRHRGNRIRNKMDRRRALRRNRRGRIRNRQPRFDNRARPDGWLAPM